MKHSPFLWIGLAVILTACNNEKKGGTIAPDAIEPVAVTEPVEFDTDDPAIWINKQDTTKSLIIGTDKETGGGLYVYDLQGKIVNKVTGLKRPNNVDIAYDVLLNGQRVDVALTTEREANAVRIYTMPDLKPVDGGGIPVFEGEQQRDPMGIAVYTRPSDSAVFVIVGRKTGPADGYLWQYRLKDKGGKLGLDLVRKFGKYSGKKEIEAIAVDNQLGFIYYSDEQVGVHKYYADPDRKNNEELALFGTTGFTSDHEGISIYRATDSTGYILVSNQQDNSFMIFPREGTRDNKNNHPLIGKVPVSTLESDGSEVTAIPLPNYPNGLFVAMSNGKVFHYYDWRDIAKKAGLK